MNLCGALWTAADRQSAGVEAAEFSAKGSEEVFAEFGGEPFIGWRAAVGFQQSDGDQVAQQPVGVRVDDLSGWQELDVIHCDARRVGPYVIGLLGVEAVKLPQSREPPACSAGNVLVRGSSQLPRWRETDPNAERAFY
jgi:hypothetical protein